IGEIGRPHGVRGELRVTPMTDDPSRFARLETCVLWDAARDERETRRITATRSAGDALLVAFAGCESPEAARALVGRLIAVPEKDVLPPREGTLYPSQVARATGATEDGRQDG